MATESADAENSEREEHLRSITVTSAAALGGILAAVVSTVLTGDLIRAEEFGAAARSIGPQIAVLGVILVEIVAIQVLDLYDDFSTKDKLFVGFMTFSMWFVTWGIMLATGVTL